MSAFKQALRVQKVKPALNWLTSGEASGERMRAPSIRLIAAPLLLSCGVVAGKGIVWSPGPGAPSAALLRPRGSLAGAGVPRHSSVPP